MVEILLTTYDIFEPNSYNSTMIIFKLVCNKDHGSSLEKGVVSQLRH